MQVLTENLKFLKLNYISEHLEKLLEQAGEKNLDRIDFLEELIQAETDDKRQRLIQRRIKAARLGAIKLIEDYKFSHPRKIDEQKSALSHSAWIYGKSRQSHLPRHRRAR